MHISCISAVMITAGVILSQCTKSNLDLDSPIAITPKGPQDAPAIEVPTSMIEAQPRPGDEKQLNTDTTDQTQVSDSNTDPCVVLDQSGVPPYFLKEHGFIVTSIIKSCVTRGGQPGFEKTSPWMAMGIPCTNGVGQLQIKGKSYAPRKVSFDLSSSCPMLPGSLSMARKLGSETLGMLKENELLSFTPLSVQYWEFKDYPDAGSGTIISFNTTIGLKKGWNAFKQGNAVPVRLFGRENAWVNQQVVYQVEGEFQSQGNSTFSLEIQDVKKLDSQALLEVRLRCQKIHPPLNCDKIF